MYFISAGCSYSQIPNADTSWPAHVQSAFNLTDNNVNHLGSGAIGNEMISRNVIYHVTQALKTKKPEHILVGILWSGCDRNVIVRKESKNTFDKITKLPGYMPHSYEQLKKERDDWTKRQFYQNPLCLASDEFNYYTLNGHWTDELTVTYFNNFVDPLSAVMKTCEHILRTEWFLKQHNIKYFMAAYDYDTFFYAGIPGQHKHLYDDDSPAYGPNHSYNPIEHPDVKYLYDMIDWSFWLPIKDLGHWAKNVSKFDFRDPHDPHPSTEQHKDFTDNIILPFLAKTYNLFPKQLP